MKKRISERNPDVCFDTLWVCQFCRPLLNKDKMPCRCFLNGLESEPIPAELANLDALSKQLIQRAKVFQTIVRLGTYTAKVPKYNSLKACKGTMFFLPLVWRRRWKRWERSDSRVWQAVWTHLTVRARLICHTQSCTSSSMGNPASSVWFGAACLMWTP